MTQVINLILLLLIGLATLGGMKRGLRVELLNLAGILVAVAGGILLAKPVALLFRSLGVLEEVPYLVAFAGGFLIASLAFSIVKSPLIPKQIDLAERISGGLVGFGKGLAEAAILVYLVVGIWPRSAETFAGAAAARFVMPLTAAVDAAAGAARVLLPSELTDRVRDGYRSLQEAARGLEGTLETIEGAGETLKGYGEKVGEGAALADSLVRAVVPPPEAGPR